MMDNNHIEHLIARYLLEEITAEELMELEQWIRESPENKAYFFQLKKVSDLSRNASLSQKEIGDSWLRMRTRAGYDAEQLSFPSSVNKRRKLLLLWSKYAAVILLVFGVSWGIFQYSANDPAQNSMIAQLHYNEIIVEKGGRGNTLILSDGTKVTLNTATSFRYPTNFSDSTRTVYLDGEAMFEVVQNEEKPFIVRLKNQDITVLGTTFNIEAYGDEIHSTVTLLSGSILLDIRKDGQVFNTLTLKPSQQAITNNLTGDVSLIDINTSITEAWTKGEYKFKDETLLSITKRLEKYYDVQIRLENTEMGQELYTGTLRLDLNIEEVLKIIDYKKQFNFKWNDKDIFISRNK